jgi:ABC-type oligopeptide transport system substrate-binding subunit
MVRNGELDLYLLGWGADYLHPDNFFNPILCDGYLAFGPKDNILCDQVQASLAEFNFNNQLTQYQWASRRVYDTLPLLPLAHTRSALVIRREIFGLSASPMATEAYKDATFATAWVYLPLIRK